MRRWLGVTLLGGLAFVAGLVCSVLATALDASVIGLPALLLLPAGVVGVVVGLVGVGVSLLRS